MTRLLRTLVYNWPLKLAAIALASLLYAGLVLSQSARTFPGSVPIQTANATADMFVPTDLGSVSGIRYIVPESLGLLVNSSTFTATVDLKGLQPTGTPITLTVHVTANDPQIQVQDFTPQRISVTIDLITTRTVPIKPVLLSVPPGFELGDPQLSQSTAEVRGPQSIVERVQDVEARVQIDPSGIDVSRDVSLVPVDANGVDLPNVVVSPRSIQVKVPVFTDRRTKTLPVNPVVTGTPAAGFEIEAVVVDPLVVSVEGDANDLAALDLADTDPISISGASADVHASVGLSLPGAVQALGPGTVDVTVHLRPVTATRTYEAGLVLIGASPDRTYALSTNQVLVTVGGSVADLDRLSGTSLVLTLDVSGLGDGSHQVAPQANLTTGLSLIAVAPTPITVTIATPPPSPAPSP